MRWLCWMLVIVLAVLAGDSATGEEANTERRTVRILFLGDAGPHRPADRAKQLIPVMKERGIDVTYTEDMTDLNAANLRQYDGLLVYANIEKIAPNQEKAVLEYVAGGGAFVPIHCASYCFHNSDKLIALTGAQFQKHGTGVFATTVAAPEHPIMRGLKPIKSWDETYLHHRHNGVDRTVLSYRRGSPQAAGNDQEPWTWIRTHGKGRVFYTAWGHDHRTWGHPGFCDVVERGIRWSTRTLDAEYPSFQAPPNPRAIIAARKPKPFEYKEAKVPFYPGGGKWGQSGEANQMQLPLSAEESMKHMVTPEGFDVQLFAAEPNIGTAIAMAWDERGRLWLCESVDYPNDRQPDGKGNDRIRICEDTDGDGKADRFTVFADGLSIPTSLTFANGGVIVHQAPHTFFLVDTDGDDRADRREILLTGWGTGDTHAGPNNLQYGLDNQIWGIVGYSGFSGSIGGEQHRFDKGFYRFRPDGSKLEFIASNNNNCWGIGFSEEGHVFGSTANRNPCVHVTIPNRYYEGVGGWSSRVLPPIAATHRFATPITDRIRQVDHHGGYTAAAGHAIYTARTYPKPYWNRTALVTGCSGKLVGTFVLRRDGAGFKASTPFNLVASDDEWTAPIMAEVGPDGHVWILDWYNFIVQHNPTPAGYKTGAGNAYESTLRDKKRCRIYRVVYKGAKPAKRVSLADAGTDELVQTLKHDNMLWRRHTQRLLVERGKKDIVPALVKLVDDKTTDKIGLNVGVIHSLWTLHGLGVLKEVDSPAGAAAVRSLNHRSAGVRRNAIMVLPRSNEALRQLLEADLLNDPDPQVRLTALLALVEMPTRRDVGALVYGVLTAPANRGDRLIRDAATAAAARHDSGFIETVLIETRGNEPDEKKKPVVPLNLLANASFADRTAAKPAGWRPVTYRGRVQLATSDAGRTDGHAVHIASSQGADASWTFSVTVQPQTRYRLASWIRTKNVKPGSGMGALLNIHQMQNPRVVTKAVTGTADWTRVSVDFDSRERTQVDVNCLFGGWGQSTGEAWYDDIELIALGASTNPVARVSKDVGEVFQIVTRHYARRAPSESIVATLVSLQRGSPDVASYILDGLAEGWPQGKSPDLSADDKAKLGALMAQLQPLQQDRLLQLSRRWGQEAIFADSLASIGKGMRSRVADKSLGDTPRIDAADRLIRLTDDSSTTEWLLGQISVHASPEFTAGVLDALGQSRRSELAATLISRWEGFSPAIRRAAVDTMLRRKEWSRTLLAAVKQGNPHRSELTAEQVLRLTNHPDKDIAAMFKSLAGPQELKADRAEVLKKLLPALKQQGEVARGLELFTKRCAVCHTIEPHKGGLVGPNLTGIGARATDEILMEIVDPNRSLVGTYQLWTIETSDWDFVSGRLLSEDRKSVTLLDVTGKKHVIQRDNIETMSGQNLSIMPDGLIDDLSGRDVASLIAFLAQSKVEEPQQAKDKPVVERTPNE